MDETTDNAGDSSQSPPSPPEKQHVGDALSQEIPPRSTVEAEPTNDGVEQPRVVINRVAGEPVSKPRLFHNGRDVALSLIPLVIFCLIVAALSGNLGTRRGPGQSDDQVPPYEIAAAATGAAHMLSFPIKLPAVPADWKPNSGSRAYPGGSPSQNFGWVTPTRHFIQLTQSAMTPMEMQQYLGDGIVLERTASPHSGWDWFVRGDGRQVGTARIGSVTYGISGTGSESEYATLITALQNAVPIAK